MKYVKKITKATVGTLIVFILVLTMADRVMSYLSVNAYIALKRDWGIPDVFIENETDGTVNFATSLTGIGDLFIIGESVNRAIHNGALADGWIAAADSDRGIAITRDFLLDSLRINCTDWSSDTIIVLAYKTTANVTLLSTDTLIANGQISYTSLSTANRSFDNSANTRPAFRIDVKGTLSNVGIALFGKTYDVQ